MVPQAADLLERQVPRGLAPAGHGVRIAPAGRAGALLAGPAVLMGATLPLLVRASGDARRAIVAAHVYAMNTAGAGLGCLLSAYVLLGAYGVRWTDAFAAALDCGVGLLALVLARQQGPKTISRRAPPAPSAALSPRWVLGIAFLGGATVLGLETLWTRLLLIVFGHDVHAFASMLTALLAGLALGAVLAENEGLVLARIGLDLTLVRQGQSWRAAQELQRAPCDERQRSHPYTPPSAGPMRISAARASTLSATSGAPPRSIHACSVRTSR